MATRNRIAVVGAGLIGKRHIDYVRRSAVLGAIVDPQAEAEVLAKTHNVPWFSSIEELFADHTPDGVIIATPNQLHVDHGLACVRAGVPVLMEKPIAGSVSSARALVSAANANSVPILVGHHRRHNPLIAAAKAYIDGGGLGHLVSVHAQFWLYKPKDYFDAAWRRQAGAGPVFINLIHDVDLIRHLCGEIRRVHAVQSSAERGLDVEDTAAILVEFENGALGTLSVSDTIVAPWSWETTSGENPAYPKTDAHCYTLGGSKSSLSIPDLKVWTHPHKRSWWEPINAEPLGHEPADPLTRQIDHFVDVLSGRAAPIVSGDDGLRTLQVIEAIKTSATLGKPVDIDVNS